MKEDRCRRVTPVQWPVAADARAKVERSRTHFAKLLGVSDRTHPHWPRGGTTPSGAAKTLIRVEVTAPRVLCELMIADRIASTIGIGGSR